MNVQEIELVMSIVTFLDDSGVWTPSRLLSDTAIFMRNTTKSRSVVLLVAEGSLATSMAGPLDVFSTADILVSRRGVRGPRFQTIAAGLRPGRQRTLGGLTLDLRSPPLRSRPDAIVFAGAGVSAPDVMSQARSDVAANPRVFNWIRRCAEDGTLVATGCVGTAWLACSGLLDGRRATTSFLVRSELAAAHPDIRFDESAMVVADGPLVTAGAAMAYLDLALELVGRLGTSELRVACARVLLLDNGRRSQALFATLTHLPTSDPLVLRAAERMRDGSRSGEAGTVTALARELGVSVRAIQRAFARSVGVSPKNYWQRVRVERGRYLLETTGSSIEEISHSIGFEDSSAFYRLFRKLLGVAPGAYRARFRED